MRSALIIAVLLAAGCGSQPVPTDADNRQLDEAEAMLETAPDDLAAIDENQLDAAGEARGSPEGSR